MKEILQYDYDGEGLSRAYDNSSWMVGIKNYKPANGLDGTDSLERHNETDELFVLLSGECVLLYAEAVASCEKQDCGELHALRMRPGKLYNIPKGLWHTTVTKPDAKLILIEASDTGSHNSDVLKLTESQVRAMKRLIYSLQERA